MTSIKDTSLTTSEKTLLCFIINTFGDGSHPWADSHTLGWFSIEYLTRIFNRKAFKKYVSEQFTKQRLEILEGITQKLALKKFDELPAIDIETQRTKYDERFSISCDTDIDDNDKVVVMPVILYIPDTKQFDHKHIEILDAKKLYDWLGKFLELQEKA